LHDRLATQVRANIAQGKAPLAEPAKKLQSEYGVNYNADGLLACGPLRPFVKPVQQYLRDWQHTLVASGVAGSLIAGVLTHFKKCKPLSNNGITMDTLAEYCSHWNLPTSRGQINANWFSSDFVETDHVKHFASDVMSMMPLILAFMTDIVKPLGQMLRHTEAIALMDKILSILICCPVVTDAVHAELTSTIDQFRNVFYDLFHSFIKVKFHHLSHLADTLLYIGKTLNCFVLERKHRDYKSIVLHVFRSVEHTSTMDFVNFSIQEFVTGRFRFDKYWIADPCYMTLGGVDLAISYHLHSPIGEVHRDDVVLVLEEGSNPFVGSVNRFFEKRGELSAEIFRFRPARAACWTEWDITARERCFVDVADVEQNLSWCKASPQILRVLLPSGVKLFR
jgi:hypothetical protein